MSENHTFYNRKVARQTSLSDRLAGDRLGAVSPLMAAVVSAILSAQGHFRRTELVAAESLVELSLGALLQDQTLTAASSGPPEKPLPPRLDGALGRHCFEPLSEALEGGDRFVGPPRAA
jgi:hypothetical protein